MLQRAEAASAAADREALGNEALKLMMQVLASPRSHAFPCGPRSKGVNF